jgi:hypothetical protein
MGLPSAHFQRANSLTNVSGNTDNGAMDERSNDLPEHNPGEVTKTDQKPLSQPTIRKYALVFILITILGLVAVAALVYALNQR